MEVSHHVESNLAVYFSFFGPVSSTFSNNLSMAEDLSEHNNALTSGD